ncbi:MAG TPA: paraquat-inducible protein A [Thiotrichaceae bacterium]|nr:paraquat-inducible protein A [Thiotrichaceae bacterium]HIM08127.1 paraquat-inducible protein A [Gammaproteobacteria bacterium]
MNIRNLVACPSCDLLSDVSSLKHKEKACCSRCGHFLTKYMQDGILRVVSYSISSLVFLILANCHPFLSFNASGLESEMTLAQTALEFYRYGMLDLAIMVGTFIIILPAFLLLLLLGVALSIHLQKPSVWLTPASRLIFLLQSWCMVEVFLIGVIVSIVKISAMATLVIGISFWAYFAFTIVFTLALSSFDRFQSWNKIETLMGESQ